MGNEIMIIKIGGGNGINLEGIVDDLKNIKNKIIIVHGANSLRDELAELSGYSKKILTSLSGHTSVLSDQRLIDLQMMAYAGVRNKRIVELCQKKGINALGLSGLDGKIIEGKRNRGIKVLENGKKKIIRDFSGKPKKINTKLLNSFLNEGIIPILTVPILDESGFAINSENDDIVSLLQRSFGADTVIHLIEAEGFLKNIKDQTVAIKKMDKEDLGLWEQNVEGRMKRKLFSLKKMFENGVLQIFISDGRVNKPISQALSGAGTVIR